MNSFGRIFRLSVFGESHGKKIGVVVDGCPAGIALKEPDFRHDLERRRAGKPGTTTRREPDTLHIDGGVFNGRTTGAPIILIFSNRKAKSEEYAGLKDTPRPGHADFTAVKKYGGYNDPRGGGTFSGRMTVSLTAAGVIAKKLLAPAAIEATLLEIAGTKEYGKAIQTAEKEGDSVGGIIECRTKGLPAGLGEPFFDSAESVLSHLMFSIPGIKGIEFGSGFACSKMKGSEYNDIIMDDEGTTATNRSGGINGGITNGNDLIFRVAVRPAASIRKKQPTIHLITHQTAWISVKGRHDACIALRMPVIIEAAAAIALADLMMLEQKIPRIVREKNESG